MLQLQLPLPPLGSTVELPPPPPPWTVGMRGVVKVDNRFVGLSYNIIIIETRNSGSAHNILSKISYLLYAFLWSSNALINFKLQASSFSPSPAPPPPHGNPWAFDLAHVLVVGNMNLNCQAFLVENNCFIFE